MTSQLKWFVLLFGDIDFDGRAGRMIDIAQAFGEVHLLDCAVAAPQNRFRSYGYDRCRVAPGTSQPRRHLAFLRQALATARRMRPDVVLAEDFFTAMPGRLAAAISGARFIYDAHELIIPGKDEATSYRDRFWAALERHAAPAADLVIAANSERAQIMTDSYPLRRPASYMRNIPDVQPPSEASLAEVRTKYPTLERRTTDEILVLYQGAIVAARGLPRFMDAVAHLPANYRLIVAGDGPDRQILTALAAGDRFGGRINFLGKVLNAEVGTVARLCDIGIATYGYDSRNSLLCSPNKVFEYAQSGLSIISSDQLPLRNLLEGRPWARTLSQNADCAEVAARILELPRDRAANCESITSFLAENAAGAERDRVADLFREILG